jgi:hypothetical protein
MAKPVIIARLMPIVAACYDTQPISRSFFFELACFSLGQMVGGPNLGQFPVRDPSLGFQRMGG